MFSARNDRRPAATLIEVLIAIFVMCIGLLCVLTLFVLGAQRMSAAFRDDACARAVINARAYAQIKGLRDDQTVVAKFTNNTGNGPKADNVASDPVFVDPVGASVAGPMLNGTQINRVAPKYAPDNTQTSIQYFSLLDDVVFQRSAGTPKMLGGQIERELNYTWAYLLQRDRLGEPLSTSAQVCVFNRRPKGGTLETAYSNAIINPTDNSIILTGQTSDTANITPGNWVLDVTTNPAPNDATKKYAFANFYRISGVRDDTGGLRLDLQSPLKGYNAAQPAGTVVIFERLVEVFDIGYGTK